MPYATCLSCGHSSYRAAALAYAESCPVCNVAATVPTAGGLATGTIAQAERVRIALTGDCDLTRRDELRLRLQHAVAQAGEGGTVEVDLSACTFLDSTALSILLNAQRRLRRRGGSFRTICGDGASRRLIAMSGLVETLGVID